MKTSQVIAVLGNPEDTNGATVVSASIITLDPCLNANHMTYFLATPKGIALAHLEPTGYYTSTHCMPLDYANWISNNWNIDINDTIRNQLNESVTIAKQIMTETDLEKALIVAKAL